MEQKYYCECCNFRSKLKTDFKRHLKTKKHLSMYPNVSKMYPNVSKMYPNVSKMYPSEKPPENTFKCKYCEKTFKYSQGLSKHIKYSCKKNDDEGLKELVRLLNEKNENLFKENEKLQKQIDKLSTKLQIQNINNDYNIYNNSNNNYEIKILNYSNTDYEHLTEKDYLRCFMENNHCVKSLIEKVHFNKEKPENHNIYISNIKNNFVMLYTDGQWNLVNRTKQIDDLYDKNEYELESWFDNYKEKYPHIIKSFTRYLKNKDDDDDDMIIEVKEHIMLMLYNKRKILELPI